MQTYFFKGVVTGEEPLTVSLNSGSTHRLPRNGGYRSRAFMPATSVRGALRHACHLALNAHLAKKDEKLSLDQHFVLAQGIDITKKAEEMKSGAVDASVALREANPFISLWGRWGLGGHANVGNMYPVNEECTAEFGGGNRGVMFERNSELISYLDESEVERLNMIIQEQSDSSELIKPIKAQRQTLMKSLKTLDDSEAIAKVKEKIAELDAQEKAIKDDKKGSRESIRRPIDNFEAFVAGCEFTHRMAVQAASDEELGLFIAGLQVFAREPYLGGHRAHNCGRISATYEVSVYPEDVDKPEVIGTLSFNEDGFVVSGDKLKSVRDSWKHREMDLTVW